MSAPAPASRAARPVRVAPDRAPAVLAALAADRRARGAGAGLVIAVDGASGSGKTTLAARLAGALGAGPARPAVRVLALEALVPGWSALARGAVRAAAVLRDLRHGRAGVAPSWDWEAMRAGDPVRVDPLDGGILVLEGCGALAAAAQELEPLAALRVLVEAPAAVRRARIAERDPYRWDVAAWEAQERRLAAAWRRRTGYGPDVVVRAP